MKCQLRNKHNNENLDENAEIDFLIYNVNEEMDNDADLLFEGPEGQRNRNKFIINFAIVLEAWKLKKKKALIAAHEKPEGAEEVFEKLKK